MNKSVRNVIIFAVVTAGSGFLGIALDRLDPPEDPMMGLGALVWLVSPFLANLVLRAVGGDGWQGFGLRPHFKGGLRWYLAALVIPTVIIAAVILLGSLLGVVSLAGIRENGISMYLAAVGGVFAASMMKNFFEEFAWRGYLTPKFEAMGTHPYTAALLTGLIWASWHFPYYFYYMDRALLSQYTSLSPMGMVIIAALALPFHALAYNELRLLSSSVWPAWLMHNVANAVSMALFPLAFVVLDAGFADVILSPGTQGILHSLLMGLAGVLLYRRRQQIVQEGEEK